MSSLMPFLFGIIALLAVPGPTNSLLAAAGATYGLRNASRYIAAEVMAYLIAISLLDRWAVPAMASFPTIGALIQIGVALYLMRSAIWFWHHGGTLGESIGAVTASRIFWTTLGNPKSVILAFLILPAANISYPLLLFVPVNATIAFGWLWLGQLIARKSRSPAAPRLVYRGVAGIHVLFALMMARAAMLALSA